MRALCVCLYMPLRLKWKPYSPFVMVFLTELGHISANILLCSRCKHTLRVSVSYRKMDRKNSPSSLIHYFFSALIGTPQFIAPHTATECEMWQVHHGMQWAAVLSSNTFKWSKKATTTKMPTVRDNNFLLLGQNGHGLSKQTHTHATYSSVCFFHFYTQIVEWRVYCQWAHEQWAVSAVADVAAAAAVLENITPGRNRNDVTSKLTKNARCSWTIVFAVWHRLI